MKKKIGLVVVTYKDNFGSALQTFATQYVLEKLGYETAIFDINGVHSDINKKKIRYYLSRIFYKDERKYIIDNFYSRFRKKTNVLNDKYAENMRIRHEMYESFNKQWLKFFPRVANWNELTMQSTTCDYVLVGSDQLWRPSNIVGGFFTLEFVPKEIDKISLATSFGVSEIPKSLHKHAKKFLKEINNISVREESGKKIVKDLIGRDVPVVCDPTMLLDSKDWMIIQDEVPFLQGNYILAYFMGDNPRHRNFVKKLKEKTGYKIVGLMHGATYIQNDECFADEEYYNVGPGDFVNLIRNAQYVCTDSFHGTVFSILNCTNFFTFRRYEDSSEFSTNDRLYTLLKWSELSDHILSGNEDIENCMRMSVNWPDVLDKVDTRRNESLCYLRTALSNGDLNDRVGF